MDSVKVAIRIRPLISREQGSEILWTADTHQIKHKDIKGKSYVFDRVFDSDESTSDVYEEIVEPIVQSAMDGFNGTVFAYGQTSSGKTYTMMGSRSNPGIIPLSVQETFAHIDKTPEREFLFRVSYMEIYNEVVKDLLSPSAYAPGLQIREDEFRNTVVQGLTEKLVMSAEEVMQLMIQGDKRRHIGCTNMNERSSRSHTIFRMIIESRERADANSTRDSIECDSAIKVSQLNLVDLAGSERASQSGAEGQRLKEGCHINKSLSTLGLVINQICKASESGQSAQFISYRDSKLTRILQPSLGGNARTAIICAVTPVSADDTDSTLRFASSAKKIKNTPHVNEVLSDEALLFKQKREINQLKKKILQLELNAGKKQTEEFTTLLEEKNKLQKEQEDKILMLKRMLLVSTHPADTIKRQRATRRETWCPGKLAAPMTPQPGLEKTLNQSNFFQKLDQTLMGADFEPIAAKRARFLENPVTSTSHYLTPRSKLKADEASEHFGSLESELDQLRKVLSDEKSKHLKERESFNFKLMRKDQQMSEQQETLDLTLEEKSRLEEELEGMEKKMKTQSEKIADFMKKEKHWENANPDLRALRNENQDLYEQLKEVCSQRRSLQEKSDQTSDSLYSLQTTLNDITKDSKAKDESIEDYKQQVSALQTQLEETLAHQTHSPTALKDVTKLEDELKEFKENLQKNISELEEKDQRILELENTLDEIKKSGSENEVEELHKILEEQTLENLQLRTRLNELNNANDTDGHNLEIEILKSNLEQLQNELLGKEEDIMNLKKETERKPFVLEDSMNKSIKVGEKTFGDYLTACEALVEQRDTLITENKTLKENIGKMKVELEEATSNRLNESGKFGEKTMIETIEAYENMSEKKTIVEKELENLLEEYEKVKVELSSTKEHVEFLEAEKEMMFEQEKESMTEVEKLKEQLKLKKEEIQMGHAENNSEVIVQSTGKDKEVEKLQEEIFTLMKSSEDAQEMLQEANKNLANSNSLVQIQEEKIVELEKELSRVKSDVESFDTMTELTKQKYERRIEELAQQLQSAYDQIGGENVESSSPDSAKSSEYKILLDEKESEIENLKKKLESSSSRLEELQTLMDDYKMKSEESKQQDDDSQDSRIQDLLQFLEEYNLTLDEIRSKLDVVNTAEDEKAKILVDAEAGSQRILELEEELEMRMKELGSLEKMKERILELENEVSDRDVKLKELENSLRESSTLEEELKLKKRVEELETSISERESKIEELEKLYGESTGTQKQEEEGFSEQLDELRSSLKKKEEERESMLSRISEIENLLSLKEEEVKNLSIELSGSKKKESNLAKKLEEAQEIPGSDDDRNLRDKLAETRKELLEMTEKYDKLHTDIQHAQGALLAETNRDLGQQRLLQDAERQRRESALEIASEREAANKQINQLLQKVNDLQTALCKANVDKDVANRQSDKMTQECEFLRQQVKCLENIHKDDTSVLPRGRAMDPDKMAVKIKQLSLNLELTKQTSDKLATVNKTLQEENKRLESEMVQIIRLRNEVARLEAVLEQERKLREENSAREVARERETTEMRERIVELQNNLKQAETNFTKHDSELNRDLQSAQEAKTILQEEVDNLRERISSFDAMMLDLKNKEEEAMIQGEESSKKMEEMRFQLEDVQLKKKEDEDKIGSLEERLDNAIRILESEKEKCKNLEMSNQEVITDLEDTKQALDEKDRSVKDMEAKNELLLQNLDQLKGKLDKMKRDAEVNLSDEQEELKQELEGMRYSLKEKEEERESLVKRISELEEESRKITPEKEEFGKLQDEMKNLLKEKEDEREFLEQKIAQLEDESEKLTSESEKFEKLQEGFNVLLQERDSLKISSGDTEEDKLVKQEEVNELRESNAQLKKKVEDLESKIQENFDDAGVSVQVLQEQHTLLTQEKDSLQDRVRDLEVELEMKKQEEKSGEDSLKVEELMNKISDLESELEEMILAKEDAEKLLEETREEHEKVDKKDSESSDEVDALKNQILLKEDEIQGLKSEIENLEKKSASLEQELASRAPQESTDNDDGIGFAASLDQELIENLSDQVADLKLQLEEKDEVIEDLKRDIESLRCVGGESEEDDDSLKRLRDEKDELCAKILELENLLKMKNETAENLQKDEDVVMVQELRKKLEENEFELEGMRKEKDDAMDKLEKILEESSDNDALLAKEEEVKILSMKQNEYKTKISDLESLLSAEKVEMAEMKQKLLDLSESLEKEDSRIRDMKRSKESMEEDVMRIKGENKILQEKLGAMVEVTSLLELEVDEKREDSCEEGLELQDSQRLKDAVVSFIDKFGQSKLSIGKLQEEIAELKKKIQSLESEKEELRIQCHNVETKRESLGLDEDSKSEKISQLEADVGVYKEKASSLDEQLNSVYAMIQEKASLMEEYASSRETLEKQVEILQQEKESLIQEHASSLETLEKQLENLQKEKTSLMEEYGLSQEALEKEVENLQREKTSLMEGYASSREILEKEFGSLQEENAEIRKKLQDNLTPEEVEKMKEKSMDEVKEKIAALEDLKDSLTSEVERLQEDHEKLEKEKLEALNKIQNLEEDVEKIRSERDSLLDDMERKEQDYKDSEILVKDLQDELKRMAVLEEELVILRDSKSSSENRLKDSETVIQDLTQERDSLKLAVDAVENEKMVLEDEMKKNLDDNRKMVENLKQDLEKIKTTLKTTEKLKFDAEKESDSLRKEVQKLNQTLESISKSENKNSSQVDSINKQLIATEAKVEEYKGLLYKKELEVQTLQTQVSKWEQRHADVKSDLENAVEEAKKEIASQNEQYVLKIYKLEEKLAQRQKLEKDLALVKKSSSDTEASLKAELQKEKEKLKRLNEKVADLENDLEKEHEKMKETKKYMIEKISNLEDKLIEADEEIEDEKKKYKDLEEKMRNRAQNVVTSDFESMKEALNQAKLECKDEKQKNTTLTTQLAAEKRRCEQLITRLESTVCKNANNVNFDADDLREAEKNLYIERQKTKELHEKLAGQDGEFKKKLEEMKKETDKMRKSMRGRIDELEDKLIEADGEVEDEKKKCKVLEEEMKNIKHSVKQSQEYALRREVEEKGRAISRLEIKLKTSVDPLERQIQQLKEELKMSDERFSTWKHQMKIFQKPTESSVTRSGLSRVTRSSTKQVYPGASSGVVVQDTKVYILEMENLDNQRRIKFLEKELAKYMDIETKRRAENVELHEENKKYRNIIKKAREKKHFSSDVMNENSPCTDVALASASTAMLVDDAQTPAVVKHEENCKSQ